MKNILICFLSVLIPITVAGQANEVPQASSLKGKPLYSPVQDPKIIAKSDSTIAAIRAAGNLTEDNYVEIGRQLVATARYKEAVENYSTGLERFPNSFKLLRHRGHRYLTLRKLDLVIKDLVKASDLIKSKPDSWEVDATGKQTDTYQHQIDYHLGVYYFLTKSYKEAVLAFEKSLKEAHEPNEIVGTTDWLYNAYQRNGQKAEAEKLIKSMGTTDKADHEQAYFRRILLYRGMLTPTELVDETTAPDKMSIQDVTKNCMLKFCNQKAGLHLRIWHLKWNCSIRPYLLVKKSYWLATILKSHFCILGQA